jgi:hypothetical protein
LAAGWSFLAISDLILLFWLDVTVQIIAIGIGSLGLLIIIVEFVSQWKRNKKN